MGGCGFAKSGVFLQPASEADKSVMTTNMLISDFLTDVSFVNQIPFVSTDSFFERLGCRLNPPAHRVLYAVIK